MGKSAKKRQPEGAEALAMPAPPRRKKAPSKKAPGKKAPSKKSGAKNAAPGRAEVKRDAAEKAVAKKAIAEKAVAKKADARKADLKKLATKKKRALPIAPPAPPLAVGASPAVLDRLWAVVNDRRTADPAVSHSARLLSRGTAKVAQKFGEEAVECLIEAVGRNRDALVGESADVLYHLIVMWVDGNVRPEEVWAELQRREGISGVAEKASRARALPLERGVETTKIP